MKVKKYLISLLLILLGVGASVGILSQRITAEEANKTYDIVLDYASVEEMAEDSEEDIEFWLKHFAGLGVDKLGLQEESISTLSKVYPGVFYMEQVSAVRSNYGWQDRYPEEICELVMSAQEDTDVVVVCADSELLDWVLDALDQRCELEFPVVYGENGDGFLYLSGDGDATGADILNLPLGLDPQKQAMAEQCGYTLIPRTICVENLNGISFAESVLDSYSQLGAPYIIGGGSGILGADDMEQALALNLEYLEQTGTTLTVIEANDQSMNLIWDGLDTLVEASGENAVRVFSMWNYVQWRYAWYNYDGCEEIVNCMYRAAYERNCRIIYLKMMMRQMDDGSTEYITDPEEYTTMITGFNERMAEQGYAKQTVTSMGELEISYGLLILVAFGAVAAAVMVFDLIIPLSKKWFYIITAVGCLGAAGVLYLMPSTGRLILSIGGGIAMPLLAAVELDEFMENSGKKLALVPQCLLAVLGTALVAFVGGLFASAPLSDSSYMLEMELYRGVKIMQLIPLAAFAFYYIKVLVRKPLGIYFQRPKQERKEMTQKLLDTYVQVRHVVICVAAVLVLAVAAAVGSYYIARTGHTSNVATADLELVVRNFLEETLTARPRTKEFLIGYPCIMLFVWCRRKGLNKLAIVPGVGAMIGLTSITNTFLHIRTRFCLSLIRVLTGIGFGVVVGLIALAVANWIYSLIKKRVSHV